jgi:NAD+ diphosphatase
MPLPDLGPRPPLGYVDHPIERAAELRGNADALAALTRAAASGTYALSGEFVLMKTNGTALDPLFTMAELSVLGERTETLFLGLTEGHARFATGIAAAALPPLQVNEALRVADLRSIAVQGLVAAEHLAPLAEAKALLHWHGRHRYCANCGAPTEASDAGWRRDCAACGTHHFPRTDPVVIMLAVRGDTCLLGRQARFAPGMWSCLAGFVEPGETIEQAVRRETHEEAGIACGQVRYLASQPWPFPMSMMIGCHAWALSEAITIDRTELEDARWFPRDEVAAMLLRRHPDGLATPPPVAIAHHIIRAWIEKGDGVFD